MDPLVRQLEGELRASHRIERELGGGGMSRVFLATELALSRSVVVKVLPPEMAASVNAERFRREIHIGAQLQHPHIVPVLTAGAGDSLLYYTMPYVAGESLRERLARGPALSADEAMRIWVEALDALSYAHSRGVVHRDIKPDNILLSNRHATVTDFGIARAVAMSAGESRMTATGLALGTPAYMAPEQAVGDRDVDHRADIYAAGLVMYEMLTGASPFGAVSPREMLAAQLTREPQPIVLRDPNCPRSLGALVMRCIAKDPADRPQSAGDVLTELESLAIPAAKDGGAARRRGRRPWLAGVVALAVLVSAGAWTARVGRLPFTAPAKPANDTLRLGVVLAETKFDAADSILSRNFAEFVLADLANESWLRVIGPRVVEQVAEVFGFSPASMTRDTIVFFAKRGRTAAYLTLGLSRAGSGWVFSAEATGSKNDNSIGVMTAAANTPSDIPAAMQRVSTQLRRRLVATRRELPVTSFRALATGVSPEAVEYFMEGQAAVYRKDYPEAVRKLREAVRLDSTFVEAWARLAGALANAGSSPNERMMALSNTYRMRDRIRSPLERLAAIAEYWRATGRDDRALVAIDSVLKIVPEGFGWFLINPGLAYMGVRRYEVAERLFRRAIDTSYGQLGVWNTNLIRALLYEGKTDEARAEIARMERGSPSNPYTQTSRFAVLSTTRDWAGLDSLSAQELRHAKPQRTSVTALRRAWIAAVVGGRMRRSDSLAQSRALSIRTSGGPRSYLIEELLRARSQAELVGDTLHARAILDSALRAVPWESMPPLDRPYISLLSALAAMGDRTQAEATVADWSRSMPSELKMVDSLSVLASRGDVMLAGGDARAALRLYRLADVHGCASCFYPRYARAYDQLKRGDSAAVWYEKYVSTQSPDLDMVDAFQLAHAYFRLGELYEERHEWAKAVERYQNFITLWSRADPSLQSSVREVTARVARLR